MALEKWSKAHPDAHEAVVLGERHATYEALSRVEFLDWFDLNVDDIRDGYTATGLYHLYLQARIRTRMDGPP
ncbi:hypothetical protein ACTWPT_59310 [Nonomuraea sp. 3N208]|uniref:hypothetical protein n=1 Tax=Nonomuraea sp. 3N208 TaxID=3457421 RepID=UPI003FD2C89D